MLGGSRDVSRGRRTSKVKAEKQTRAASSSRSCVSLSVTSVNIVPESPHNSPFRTAHSELETLQGLVCSYDDQHSFERRFRYVWPRDFEGELVRVADERITYNSLSFSYNSGASELDCSRRKIAGQTHTDVVANRTNFTERTTAIGPCADRSLFGSNGSEPHIYRSLIPT